MKVLMTTLIFLIGFSFTGNASLQPAQAAPSSFALVHIDCAELGQSTFEAMKAMGATTQEALETSYQARKGCEENENW